MAKNKKMPKQERIPEGMSRKDYADAAFRKKVTIIMGCILLVFVIGICAVIFAGWYNNEQLNKEYNAQLEAFNQEKSSVLQALEQIEADGGTHEDKAQVKINLEDHNFIDWISVLDASYQGDRESESYAQFGGATIHLQGMFITKEFTGGTQYWVYRNHIHEGTEHHEHSDSEDMIPIEVIFRDDEEVAIPEDGTWVDVTGIVGPDSTVNLSAVRYAEMEIMEEAGETHVK